MTAISGSLIANSLIRIGLVDSGVCERYIYTADSIDDYMSAMIPLSIGDVISFQYIAPTSYPAYCFFTSGNGANPLVLFQDPNGNVIRFDSGRCTVKIDGSEATNLITVLPTDGAIHLVEMTIVSNGVDLDTFLAGIGGSSGHCNFAMFNIKKNDGAVFNFPVDDGPTSGVMLRNLGSGADALAMNFNPEGWSKIPCLPPETNNSITALGDNEVTALGDNIIHT